MLHTTIKQKQWQLYLLGYLENPEDIDGIWGPKSESATLYFQKDSFPDSNAWDGIFGPVTEERTREIVAGLQTALGAYSGCPLLTDGLAGPLTVEAVKEYQRAAELSETGIADAVVRAALFRSAGNTEEKSGTFWEDMVYFTREEFRCRCGGAYCSGFPAEMREQVVRIAEAARKHFGRPGHVVSGLRCRRWNALQGGVENSQHMVGEALDFRIEGVSSDTLLAFVRTMPHRYAYRINGTNVHVDIPKGAG